MNHPSVPTPYPAVAELFFRGVTAIDESVRAIKIALFLCDGLIVVVLLRWLTMAERDPWLVLAYAWNPLVALGGAGSGHIDLLGAMFLVACGLWLTQRRTLLASVAFALAVGVKFLPVVLVPLLWRRLRGRDALAASGIFLAFDVPYQGVT